MVIKSQEFKDISATFKINPLNRDAIAIKNETAIARSVRNLLFTAVDEVPYSDIGSSINRILFENMNSMTSSALESEIRNTLTYEPRISLIDVVINPNYENNEYNVTLTYRIIGIDVPPQQLNVVLVSTR
jgi:phage baseplate assembly protein W